LRVVTLGREESDREYIYPLKGKTKENLKNNNLS